MERREVLLQQLAREPLAVVDQILDLEAKLAAAQAQIAELRRQLFGSKAEKLSPEQQAQMAELASDLQHEAQQPPPLSREVLEEERRDQCRRRKRNFVPTAVARSSASEKKSPRRPT
jgi:hypothetical protein